VVHECNICFLRLTRAVEQADHGKHPLAQSEWCCDKGEDHEAMIAL